MYSDKTFTTSEFAELIPKFAQSLINKISERNPNAKLNVTQETPASYLFTVKGFKLEYYLIELLPNNHIQSTSVYPF